MKWGVDASQASGTTTLAEADASLAYMAFVFDWDWARADHEFRRVPELNPSLPQAHAGHAKYLLFISRRHDRPPVGV